MPSERDDAVGAHLSSLDAGLRVMAMLVDHDSVNVSAVSRHLGCSRSTAYRILNTLRNRGIVTIGPGGRGYYPGPVLIELARPRGVDQEHRQRLRPVIEHAVALSGETVHVAALIGTHIVFFDGLEADRAVRASLRPGYLRPAHAISAGKLLLSHLADWQIRDLYPGPDLPRLTPWTLTTVEDLLREIAEIRERGFALNSQGVEVGLAGVSVPIPGRSWREQLALCATIPLDRGSEAELLRVKDCLVEATRELA